MKTITVEYDDVNPSTIEHRLSDTEAVLSIGNRRYPAALSDRQALLAALHVSDAIARENVGWRSCIVAALQKLDADERARENATS